MYVRGLEIESYFVIVAGSAYVNGAGMYVRGATWVAWSVEAGDSNPPYRDRYNPGDGAAETAPRSNTIVTFTQRKIQPLSTSKKIDVRYGTYEFQHDDYWLVQRSCNYEA